jgi:hypothetical protein
MRCYTTTSAPFWRDGMSSILHLLIPVLVRVWEGKILRVQVCIPVTDGRQGFRSVRKSLQRAARRDPM